MVRTGDELAAVVAGNPFADVADDGSRLLVTFFDRAPDPADLDHLDPSGFLPEQFRLAGRELYLWMPQGMQNSALHKALDGRPRGQLVATARNWNTVTKLLEIAGA